MRLGTNDVPGKNYTQRDAAGARVGACFQEIDMFFGGDPLLFALVLLVFVWAFWCFQKVTSISDVPDPEVLLHAIEVPGGKTLVAYMVKAGRSHGWRCVALSVEGFTQDALRYSPPNKCSIFKSFVDLVGSDPGKHHWSRDAVGFEVEPGTRACGGVMVAQVARRVCLQFEFRRVSDGATVKLSVFAEIASHAGDGSEGKARSGAKFREELDQASGQFSSLE